MNMVDVNEIVQTVGWKNSLYIMKNAITGRNWLSTIRSFTEFGSPSHFQKPASRQEAYERLKLNSSYYLTNYLIMFFILVVVYIITSPFLLFSIIGITACSVWANKQEALTWGSVKISRKP
eukprot:UN06150